MSSDNQTVARFIWMTLGIIVGQIVCMPFFELSPRDIAVRSIWFVLGAAWWSYVRDKKTGY